MKDTNWHRSRLSTKSANGSRASRRRARKKLPKKKEGAGRLWRLPLVGDPFKRQAGQRFSLTRAALSWKPRPSERFPARQESHHVPSCPPKALLTADCCPYVRIRVMK